MSELLKLIGTRWHGIEVLAYKPPGKLHVRCHCGCEFTCLAYNLKSGATKSCGCGRRLTILARNQALKTHGGHGTPEYAVWSSIRDRTKNPNDKSWASYGGRGIDMCARWDKFENFLADMGPRPSGHSIDRKNNDLGYYPENCRWATPKEQGNNQRTNRRFTAYAQEKTVSEWAQDPRCKVNYSTLWARIKRGGWLPSKSSR